MEGTVLSLFSFVPETSFTPTARVVLRDTLTHTCAHTCPLQKVPSTSHTGTTDWTVTGYVSPVGGEWDDRQPLLQRERKDLVAVQRVPNRLRIVSRYRQ